MYDETFASIPPDSTVIVPEMLPLVTMTQEQIDAVVRTVPGKARNVQDIYPLSPLQEGMLFHRLLNEHGDTYVLSTLFELLSRAAVDALLRALQTVIDRHDILRSAVLWEDLPRPVQVVYRKARLDPDTLVLDEAKDAATQLQEQMRPSLARIDLRRAPLMQVQITSRPHRGKLYALLRVHHLVCDHGSLQLLAAEAIACMEGRQHQLLDPLPFRSYVAHALEDSGTTDAEEFFRRKLGAVDEASAPFGLMNVHGDGTRMEEARCALPPALAERVRAQARRHEVSAARLFHAAWALVLAKTSGRDKVVLGTVILAAQQRGGRAPGMLGMSVNTLPLMLRLDGTTALGLVAQTNLELSALLKYEQTPLTLVQRCSGMSSAVPLFTTILNYRRTAPIPGVAESSEHSVRVIGRGEAWTNYPLTLIVDDLGESFALTAQTDRSIAPQRVASYMQTALESLISALEQAPQTPALTLSILPVEERRQVIELFNQTDRPFRRHALIHQLFEEQVERSADAVALRYKGHEVSYAALNFAANQLARYLRDRGVGADQLVAVCVERGPLMATSLLATLKAGAGFLPLDHGYPADRLEYMLRDAKPQVVLIEERLRAALPLDGQTVIALDSAANEIARRAGSNLDPQSIGLTSRHLAYVIYTSGSTGAPKGVAAEHRGTVNRIVAQRDIAAFREDDICCQKTSISFVDAIFEIMGPLSYGRPLVLADAEECKDVRRLAALIDQERITRLISVPSLAAALLEDESTAAALRNLRYWTLSGEELKPDLLRGLQLQLPHCTFVNLYGSSEVAADATCDIGSDKSDEITIGRPIANARVYVLDGGMQPVPIGVTGELYIGGMCVARGYLNRPDLTAQKFVTDEFGADPQGLLYRTGDLGRWRMDGRLEYLGRSDSQVKIRGFRVELGEIEARLREYGELKQAIVVARDASAGAKRLVAYVVAADRAPSVDALREHCQSRLPDYMVPSAFVLMESLPLTPNGKLDRRALPEPPLNAYTSREYVPPQGDSEELLAQIWRSLLSVERVGRDDSFFALGGHSLLAMQAIARIQSSFSVEVSIRSLFESTTLRELAAHIDELLTAQMLESVSAENTGIEQLLQTVMAIPDSRVRELLNGADSGRRPS